MGTLGWQEITVIFFLALVLFGPKELPKIGRTIGKAIAEFRRASSDLKATFDRELNNLERESHSINEAVGNLSDPSDYRYNYGYDSYYDPASTQARIEPPASEAPAVNAPAPETPAEAAKTAAPEGTVPATGDHAPSQEPVAAEPAPPKEPAGGPSSAVS